MWCIVRELPGEGQHVASDGLENVRIDGVDRIARLGENADALPPLTTVIGRDASFFERHMIAAQENSRTHPTCPKDRSSWPMPFGRALLKTR